MKPDPITRHDDETVEIDGGAPLTTEGSVLGTISYMSPEQAQGRAVNPQSDIFSLTVILREMLTAQRTFQKGTSVETMTSAIPA